VSSAICIIDSDLHKRAAYGQPFVRLDGAAQRWASGAGRVIRIARISRAIAPSPATRVGRLVDVEA
jgi:hypothetical protein